MLYVKHKSISSNRKFTVKDEKGNDKYSVEGERNSIGLNVRIYDSNFNELAFLQQKVLSFMPKFFLFVCGEQVAEIRKKVQLLKPKYEISGLNWIVEGDVLNHDYCILEAGKPVATIHKKWLSWGDSFEVDVFNPIDEVFALSVTLVIDHTLDLQHSDNGFRINLMRS